MHPGLILFTSAKTDMKINGMEIFQKKQLHYEGICTQNIQWAWLSIGEHLFRQSDIYKEIHSWSHTEGSGSNCNPVMFEEIWRILKRSGRYANLRTSADERIFQSYNEINQVYHGSNTWHNVYLMDTFDTALHTAEFRHCVYLFMTRVNNIFN